MSIEFTRWPDEDAQRYREAGLWIDRPLSDMLAQHADSDAPMVINGDQVMSYRDMHRASDRLAAALHAQGVRRGDTALVQLGNVHEFYLSFFALLKLGAVPVNALYSHQRNELMHYAVQLKPRLLIADRSHRLFQDNEFVDMLCERCPMLRTIVYRDSVATPDSLDTLMAQAPDKPFRATPTPADEVAFFQLSGGSTGTPKLIPRTHNDYDYSVRRSVEMSRFDAHTRFLCALPAPHNFPLSSPGALGVFHAGGCVIMASDPSPEVCFPLIARHRVNVTALVPTAVLLWMEALDKSPLPKPTLETLQLLQVGGARLSEAVARRIPDIFDCNLQQVFGMAEGLVNYTRLDDDAAHRFTTQGSPMSPFDEVWVADSEGQPLPPGQVGRLMTKGPYTFRGYYQAQDHNATVFTEEGFYCSGDLVEMTEDGYLRVLGREKDQINRGGEKIAAEEIEQLLETHPDIRQVALVSVPDELLGEHSCAFVLSRAPWRPHALRAYLRQKGVADFKLPDQFISVDILPKTPVGKIDKQRLRRNVLNDTTPSPSESLSA